MECEKTTLEDLAEIVRNAPEFKHPRECSTFRGKISSEALEAEYDGNKVSIGWVWPGRLEDGEGFRDSCLNAIVGSKKGKVKSEYPWYLSEVTEIASIAREKYLSQTENLDKK